MSPSRARPSDPVQLSPTRATKLLGRAVGLRCPNCGGRGLFRRWLKMERICPSCHLRLDRGETDYFLGGYTVNFIVSELLIVAGAALGIFLSWPDVPWRLITWSLVLLVILAPIFFYPFAKTLWLATDLIFRPLTLKDLDGHGENLPTPEMPES
ncbi:MAG: DUF983 domain-containing protein [Gemmatimonadota bacterium]